MDRYQISLSATDLPNHAGLFRTSSPYASVRLTSNGQIEELGETEHMEKCLSPDWARIFFCNLSPSGITNIEVTIYDYNGGNERLQIGEASFEAIAVYQEPGKTSSMQIGRKSSSQLHCHVEKSSLGNLRGDFQLHMRGLDMKNVEPGLFGLGRSDPFYEVSKKDSDYSVGHVKWNVVYRSESIDNNLNPLWEPAHVDLEALCYGKLDWPLKIRVLDHNNNGKHRTIGECETTLSDLQNRIARKGNADREQAIQLGLEDQSKTFGLLCVLKAEVNELKAVSGH